MHRTATATLAALLLAGLTACTSSGSDDTKAPATAAAGKLSAAYKTKLTDATTAEAAICNKVGDQACAEHLTDITLVVTDLEQDIDAAGGADTYPRTTKQIADINEAADAYTEHECLGDENASIEGSPCPDDARTIMSGGAALLPSLEADEAKNG